MSGELYIGDIQSGDLLIWEDDPYNAVSDLLLKAIRHITMSNYGHVGIAWRVNDQLNESVLVIEATIPRVKINKLRDNREFFCVPMGVTWDAKAKDFLMSKVGLHYSITDAIRAGFGWTVEKNDSWQCAELAHDFYEECGIVLPKEYTPAKLVDNASKARKQAVYRVAYEKDTEAS